MHYPHQTSDLDRSCATPQCSGGLSADFAAIYPQCVSAVYTYFYHHVSNIPDAEDQWGDQREAAALRFLADFGRAMSPRCLERATGP